MTPAVDGRFWGGIKGRVPRDTDSGIALPAAQDRSYRSYTPTSSDFSGGEGHLQRGAYGVPQVQSRRQLSPEIKAKAMELYRMGDTLGAAQLMRKAFIKQRGLRVNPKTGRLEMV